MADLIKKKIEELREQFKNHAEPDPQYRDRALEMRKMHGSGKQKISFSFNSKISRIKTKPLVSTSKPISEDNIGNKMLKKMGWKTGEGLGTNKDGIIEPLPVFNID